MKKYYAYIIKETGEKGIFNTWNECRQKVENYKFALYRKFETEGDAKTFLQNPNFKCDGNIGKGKTFVKVVNENKKIEGIIFISVQLLIKHGLLTVAI